MIDTDDFEIHMNRSMMEIVPKTEIADAYLKNTLKLEKITVYTGTPEDKIVKARNFNSYMVRSDVGVWFGMLMGFIVGVVLSVGAFYI